MKFVILLCAQLLVCSCTHSLAPRSDIYVHPAKYKDQNVKLCGYVVDSANIFESADSEDHTRDGGLSIAERGPLDPLHRGWTCVEGEIVEFGCATGPRICLEAAYDYAIKVRHVISSR